jgi:hypothetical protein
MNSLKFGRKNPISTCAAAASRIFTSNTRLDVVGPKTDGSNGTLGHSNPANHGNQKIGHECPREPARCA